MVESNGIKENSGIKFILDKKWKWNLTILHIQCYKCSLICATFQ